MMEWLSRLFQFSPVPYGRDREICVYNLKGDDSALSSAIHHQIYYKLNPGSFDSDEQLLGKIKRGEVLKEWALKQDDPLLRGIYLYWIRWFRQECHQYMEQNKERRMTKTAEKRLPNLPV